MRTGLYLAVAAALLGGCFDEGGDAARTQAAITTAQGLIAFGDIHSNLQTDPAKAGEALLEFIKWPVAADSLISPPFAGADDVMTATREAPATPVPACLEQTGEPACDSYSTTDTCEAGAFTFRGTMTRRCAKCDDPKGSCSYGWTLPELSYTSAKFSLSMSTAGSWAGAVSQITPNLSARYDLEINSRKRAGNLTACACTTFTVEDGPPPTGKPRKLVNSSFLVRGYDSANRPIELGCALVSFDGHGDVTVFNQCTCKDGSVCSAPPPSLSMWPEGCGNGVCDVTIDENYQSCPVDCPLTNAVCGNGTCEIGEDRVDCVEDCVGNAP